MDVVLTAEVNHLDNPTICQLPPSFFLISFFSLFCTIVVRRLFAVTVEAGRREGDILASSVTSLDWRTLLLTTHSQLRAPIQSYSFQATRYPILWYPPHETPKREYPLTNQNHISIFVTP